MRRPWSPYFTRVTYMMVRPSAMDDWTCVLPAALALTQQAILAVGYWQEQLWALWWESSAALQLCLHP